MQVLCSYVDAPLSTRLGVGAALLKTAPVLGDAEVTLALDFLIRNGLADSNDKVGFNKLETGDNDRRMIGC